jgi:hypothetical protein
MIKKPNRKDPRENKKENIHPMRVKKPCGYDVGCHVLMCHSLYSTPFSSYNKAPLLSEPMLKRYVEKE